MRLSSSGLTGLAVSLICSLGVSLHDVVHLLQLVCQPLLAAELVLLQCENELLVVLHRVPEVRLR